MSILSQLRERNQDLENVEQQICTQESDPLLYDNRMDQAICEFNEASISMMDYPESTRHQAFILEGQITAAANEDRRQDFLRLLSDWRNCFH